MTQPSGMTALLADTHRRAGDIWEYNLKSYGRVILLGDIIDVLPCGLHGWLNDRGKFTINSIGRNLPLDTLWIIRNHEGDRVSWMRFLFKDFPHIEFVHDYEERVMGRRFLYRHGSEYTDWRLWSIGADDLVAFMTEHGWTRDVWYWYCRKKGWMNNERPAFKTDSQLRHYNDWLDVIWKIAMKEAMEEPETHLFMGHTHRPRQHYDPWSRCWLINLAPNKLMQLDIEGHWHE